MPNTTAATPVAAPRKRQLVMARQLRPNKPDGRHASVANSTPKATAGDHDAPTRKLAESLGMDRYFAQVLPADKADYVEKLQKEGRKVCFVGDGINEALVNLAHHELGHGLLAAWVGESVGNIVTAPVASVAIVLLTLDLIYHRDGQAPRLKRRPEAVPSPGAA